MQHDVWQPLIWRRQPAPGGRPLPMLVRLRRDLRLAAQFGAYAARSPDLQAVLDASCRVAAEGLGARFVKLLVYQPGERSFLMGAGVGWGAGIVGQVRLETDVNTAAGSAWQSGQSVICNDLVAEGRFRVPDLLVEHGVVRSVAVVIPGHGAMPFGILEVGSAESGEFAAHDAHFLQIIAQGVAAAPALSACQELHAAWMARSDNDGFDVSERYRALAGVWADEADELPPGPARDAYLSIADGYARLAAISRHLTRGACAMVFD